MRPPSVDSLARSLARSFDLPHPLLVHAARSAISEGDVDSAAERARILAQRLLGPLINATGVLLHTNLGRAPVAHRQDATYTNLELDVETGRRGSRDQRISTLLAAACGAEDAMVVNNNAAAVMLVLAALASGRGVAVSRSQMIEIGGGFRVPDVLAQSGAHMVEVGTTNRTRLADYAAAIEETAGIEVALVLMVHQSNYRIVGFTETVGVRELAGLGPPLVVDLGSGLLDAACPWLEGPPPEWLRGEPAARQTLESGADLVTFSGDKLLGGPQAGIIAGRAELVSLCRSHPLARALRPGGLVLAALGETLLAYLRKDGDAIPFWRMATTPVEQLRSRAEALGVGEVTPTVAVPGGGTLPGAEIPSIAVALEGDHTAVLRAGDPPVIARVAGGRTLCDLRTVDPAQDAALEAAIARALDP